MPRLVDANEADPRRAAPGAEPAPGGRDRPGPPARRARGVDGQPGRDVRHLVPAQPRRRRDLRARGAAVDQHRVRRASTCSSRPRRSRSSRRRPRPSIPRWRRATVCVVVAWQDDRRRPDAAAGPVSGRLGRRRARERRSRGELRARDLGHRQRESRDRPGRAARRPQPVRRDRRRTDACSSRGSAGRSSAGGTLGIYHARSSDGGASFSAPVLISAAGVSQAHNPHLSAGELGAASRLDRVDRARLSVPRDRRARASTPAPPGRRRGASRRRRATAAGRRSHPTARTRPRSGRTTGTSCCSRTARRRRSIARPTSRSTRRRCRSPARASRWSARSRCWRGSRAARDGPCRRAARAGCRSGRSAILSTRCELDRTALHHRERVTRIAFCRRWISFHLTLHEHVS